MLPRITRDQLIAAFARFDAELRDSEDWHGWSDNKSHKWAISFQGRLYPIKQAVGLAAGVTPASFSGGDALNQRIAKLGFEVVRLADRPVAPPAPTPEIAELQTRIADLEGQVLEADLRTLTSQARLRLALTALADVGEYADHAEGCPIARCICGYVAAASRADKATRLAAGTPSLEEIMVALSRQGNTSA